MARRNRGNRPVPAPPVPRTLEEIQAEIGREEAARQRRGGGRARPAPPIPETLAEIIERFRRERRPPEEGPKKYIWYYKCRWYDRDTGEQIGSSFESVTTDSGTNYQQAAALARRLATQPDSLAKLTFTGDPLTARMVCRRVGEPAQLP